MKKLLFTLLLAAATLPGWADEYYLVGGCTDSGWNAGESTRSAVRAYTPDGTTWAWAGYISAASDDNAGRFKIPNSTGGWDGFWATTQNTIITSEGVDLSTDGTDDKKFRLAETGYYLITFNTSDKKIYAQKLSAPSMDGDYYCISSVNDYYYFAAYIASNDTRNAKAKLMNDLDFGGKTFIPLASERYPFSGEFDGNKKKIINASLQSSSYAHVGFICQTNNASIHDLEFLKANIKNQTDKQNTGVVVGTCNGGSISKCAVVNSYVTGWDHTGSIVGCAKGACTINNCFSNAKVVSNTQAGGLVGTSEGITLEHCLFMGPSIEGTYASNGGACGLISLLEGDGTTTIKNNLVAAQYLFSGGGYSYCKSLVNTNGKTPTVDNNYSWTITRYGNATSNFTYGLNSNDANGYQKAPSDINKAFFSNTLGFDFNNTWEMVSGKTYYGGSYPILKGMSIPDNINISSGEDLVDFSNFMWDNTNATLSDDIDMSGKTFKPLGNTYYENVFTKYYGTFDGQGHSIKNLIIDTTNSNIGLFGYLTNGATIQNLIIDSTCDFKGSTKVGGIAGYARGGGTVTLTNVINMANVACTGGSSGNEGNAAGLIACAVENTAIIAKNCANTGTVGGQNDQCAAFAGWTQSGTTFTNCWNSGKIYNYEGQAILYRNTGAVIQTNCYHVTDDDFTPQYGTKIGTSALTSGELCYKLNGNQNFIHWYQNLSGTNDATPVPFSSHSQVYANGNLYCNGTPKDAVTYSNNAQGENRDQHNFTDGICSNCYGIDINYLSPVNGYYEIDDIHELNWFAHYVNDEGQIDVNAKLTGDIIQGNVTYTPIGSLTNPYEGTFDGQAHYVDLSLNNEIYSYQGLFGVVTDGAFIQNVIVKGFVKGSDYVGGIVGGTKGGTRNAKKINIWCCGNEADITATGANGAGIIGVNMDGKASIILLNCYNTGEVNSNKDGGAMSGWLGGGWSNVRNCYNSGTIKNNGNTSKAFCRNNGCYFTNCYYTATSGTDNSTENHDNGSINMVEDAALTSGELCWKLGTDFTQDFSEANHPTIGSKEVHAGKWFNNEDWDVFYNEEGSSRTSYVLNLDETKTIFNLDPNFTLTAKNVSVARNIPADQWIGLCLPFDYDIPSGWEVRELTGVSGSGDDASMKFSSASTIEAGKPYIVKPTAEVTTITATDKTIATGSTNVTFGGVTMVGNLNQTDIAQGSFYINKSSELKKLTATSATLKGFRAYFTVNGSYVKALSFDFDDDATGINEELRMKNEESTSIFNLAGQRLSKKQKGINIVNGKKILK